MKASREKESVEMANLEPVSSPMLELDLHVETLPPTSSNHSFHSSLLGDIHLDLELECEEDGVTFATGDNDNCRWDFNVNHSVPWLLPHRRHYQSKSPVSEVQRRANPTIVNLINRGYIDHRQRREDAHVSKEGRRSTVDVNQSRELCQSVQTDSLKTASSSTTASSENPSTSDSYPDHVSPVSTFHTVIICPLCKIFFSSVQSLQLHFSDQHSKIKKELEIENHQCFKCGKSYSSKKILTKHMKLHTYVKSQKTKNEGPFCCHLCPYVGKKKVLLKLHMRNLHNPERKVLKCEMCSFSCIQERSFKVHKLTHEAADGKFACDQCGKLYFTMSILKRHARTHNTSKPYSCYINNCKKAFNIKSDLTDHIRTVHERNLTPMKTTLEDNQHSSQVKGPDRTTKDSLCISKLPDMALKIENNSVDFDQVETGDSTGNQSGDVTIIYDIILPECERTSFNDDSMRERSSQLSSLRTNSTISDCSEEPSHPSAIESMQSPKYQMLDSTTGNRPTCTKSKSSESSKKFLCSWTGCGKQFRDNYNLRKHICTHTGELERSCPFCRYRCIQKSALDKHMKTH